MPSDTFNQSVEVIRAFNQQIQSEWVKSLSDKLLVLKEWMMTVGPRGGKVWTNSKTGKKVYGKKPGKRDAKEQKREAKNAATVVSGAIIAKIKSGKVLNQAEVSSLAKNLKEMTASEIQFLRQSIGVTTPSRSKQSHIDSLVERAKESIAKRKKKPKSDTLAAYIMRSGGINPNDHSLQTVYSGMKEAIEDGVPLVVFRKAQRMGLDAMASELANSGYLDVPENMQPHEYLLQRLSKGHKLEYEKSQRDYDAALEEHYKAMEEARLAGIESGDIEEANRVGQEIARRETTDELLEEYGIELPASLGESEGRLTGGTDFDFGANADSPTSEIVADREDKPVQQQEQPIEGKAKSAIKIADHPLFNVAPQQVKDRLSQAVDGVRFYQNAADFESDLYDDELIREKKRGVYAGKTPEQRAADTVRRQKGSSGLYQQGNRNVYVVADQDLVNTLAKRAANDNPKYAMKYGTPEEAAQELAAHELAHAIDQNQHGFSNEWGEIATAELMGRSSGVLGGKFSFTKQASSDFAPEREAFAEAIRVVYRSAKDAENFAKDFPKSAKYLKENGLWPEH